MTINNGFLYKMYGFTNTHLIGVSSTCGILIGASAAVITFAIMGFDKIDNTTFFKLCLISIAISLISLVTVLGSILSLIFYKNAIELGLLAIDKKLPNKNDAPESASPPR